MKYVTFIKELTKKMCKYFPILPQPPPPPLVFAIFFEFYKKKFAYFAAN